MATTAEIQTAYKALYRADLNATVAAAIAGTGISLDAYIAQQLPQVATTTQASIAIAAFVTGLTPTSAKLDALTVDAGKQVASYTAMGSSHPELGAFEAFGRAFATDSTTGVTFATKYGALSNTDFINVVYAQVYGTQPNAAQLASLQGQIDYFTKLYAANNVPNGAIAAKGAVMGQIVGYAFTSSASANSSLDNQVQAVLTAAAKGDTSVYAKALPTVTDPAQIGVTITMPLGNETVSPTAADPALKSTANNDTINAPAGLVAGAKVDGGAGDDILNVKLAANYAPATGDVVSIETVNHTGGAFIFDADKVSGIKNAGFVNVTADAAAFANLSIGTALSVTDTDTAAATSKSVVFGFRAADVAGTSDTASLTVNGLDTHAKTVDVSGIEILNLAATGANSDFTLVDAALKTLNITAAKNLTTDVTASTALESVTANGAGSVTLGLLAPTTKSIDASGLTGTTGISFTVNSNALESVKFSGGNDSASITTTKIVNLDLGAGNDSLAYTQGSATAGAVLAEVNAGAGTDLVTLFTTGSAAGAAATQKVTLGSGADILNLVDAGNVVTTIVYSGTDSTATFQDAITGFRSAVTATATAGADKIDVSAFALGTANIAYSALNTTPVADAPSLFSGVPANIIAYDTGADVVLLIDSNKDGNYNFGTDLSIKLVGVANHTDITAANFVV